MKNGLFKMVSATTLAGLMFVGCGGGSSSGGSSTPTVSTGTFIDAQVKGLHYKTATQEGDTNEAGEFKYLAGETIEFKLGNLSLGSVNADSLITPYTLAGDTDISNPSDKAVNIALLLQNFDADRTDAILDVLKLKDMDLSTFSLSDTPATTEGKISTKLPDANLVTNFSLIDIETAKTNLKNNVALSAIKYNKKFTESYLQSLGNAYVVYRDWDNEKNVPTDYKGITMKLENGKHYETSGFVDANTVLPLISATYTIENGIIKHTDSEDTWYTPVLEVTDDYVLGCDLDEGETISQCQEQAKVYIFRDKSKAQKKLAELTGSTTSFVSAKTIVMNDPNPAGYMTLVFDANGNYEERGFEDEVNSSNQPVPYTCYGKWKDLGNNKIAGTCDEGVEIVRPEVIGNVMGNNGEIHLTFSDKTLSENSDVTVDFKNDNGVQEQVTITIKSVSDISPLSSISVSTGFTESWLKGRTLWTVVNGTIYETTFSGLKQTIVGMNYNQNYTVENGILKVDETSLNSGTTTYEYYKVLAINGEQISVVDGENLSTVTSGTTATQELFTTKAAAQAYLSTK